jgi:hypothetical protein
MTIRAIQPLRFNEHSLKDRNQVHFYFQQKNLFVFQQKGFFILV